MTQFEQRREKKIKNEQNLKYQQENTRRPNDHANSIPERQEKKNGNEKEIKK